MLPVPAEVSRTNIHEPVTGPCRCAPGIVNFRKRVFMSASRNENRNAQRFDAYRVPQRAEIFSFLFPHSDRLVCIFVAEGIRTSQRTVFFVRNRWPIVTAPSYAVTRTFRMSSVGGIRVTS